MSNYVYEDRVETYDAIIQTILPESDQLLFTIKNIPANTNFTIDNVLILFITVSGGESSIPYTDLLLIIKNPEYNSILQNAEKGVKAIFGETVILTPKTTEIHITNKTEEYTYTLTV